MPTDADLASDLVTYAARLVRAVRRAADLPAGVRVISLLDQHGPSGISALALADRCSQPTMSAQVKELAKRGHVTKTLNPDDSRGQLVSLTDEGRAELARVRAANGALVADRLAHRTAHTPEDLATAVAVLRDLVDTDTPATEGRL